MGQFKNLNRIVLPLLVLVNLYISLDNIINQEPNSIDYNIELIIRQRQNDNDIINFVQLQQYFLLEKPFQLYNKISGFEFEIQNKNLLDQLKFHNQENTVLNLKPILLPIVLNEITIQKFHCI